MFKNFWYALAFSDEITVKPSRHRILSQDLVMWRTRTGEVRALSDLCVHRGARLSGGWVDPSDNIVCPYHGWGYGADGACAVIPANRDGKVVSKKARVDSYPVEERHGWVWVFMGDVPEAERVPIPNLAFMDDPEYRPIRGEWLWDANYERVVENGTDQSHTPFVHAGTFGNPDDPEVREFEIDAHEWDATLTVYQRPPRKPSGGLRINRKQAEPVPVLVRTAFFFPAIVMIDITIPGLGRQIIWDTNIPLDEDTTLTKYIALRNFYKTPWADRIAARIVRKVFAEDDTVVQEVRPELIPDEMNGELHLRSDQMSLEYRRVRQQAVDLGYSVLGSAEGAKNARSIIASPYRREPGLERAWVFPPTQEGSRVL